MSAEIPIELPIEKPKIAIEKVKCECGKMISIKNLSTHQHTEVHKKAVGLPVIKEQKEEGKKDGSNKLKERFDLIDSKLDLLIDMLEEVHEEVTAEDEEDVYDEQLKDEIDKLKEYALGAKEKNTN